ncbi:MAG: hypothetical protein V7603_3517 [Micromonosporaceae bacterium]
MAGGGQGVEGRAPQHRRPQERAGRGPATDAQPRDWSDAQAGVLRLQHAAGNKAVSRLLRARAVQRQPAKNQPPNAGASAAKDLDNASMQALATMGLALSADDLSTLAQDFPAGIKLIQGQPLVLGMRFGDRLDGYRLTGFRVTTQAAVPGQGVEAWIFQVGKGRAILVSSIGGRSVQFDAGVGQSVDPNSPAAQRLAASVGAVVSSGTAAPESIRISHADTDHYNAVRALLTQAAFSNTAIEVTAQQLQGQAASAWSRMSVTVQPTQRIVQINVGAAGAVQVNRAVIDNMEITEYRSVAAHQAAASGGTYNRNRTSPVVVVRDLVNGQRMLFSADAQGRQFDEIVNAVGDTGLRRILGAEGHNLKLMEMPHHFGKQAAGPDARGMLNMLQMAYESGEGSMRLVAQTTQAFAAKPSSTFNFLDASAAAPERIEEDRAAAGQTQATRAQGSQLSQVTLDLQGIQRAVQVLQANDTALRQAYGRLAALDAMRADLTATAEALRTAGSPAALNQSVAQTDAMLVRIQGDLRTAADGVWDQMRVAAANDGMRSSADMTQVQAAVSALAARATAVEADMTRAGNAVETHRAGLSLYARLSQNAVRMINALMADDIETLYRCRAEHTDLVQAARAALGPADVEAHVTSAWTAARAEWSPERFQARTAELSATVAFREMGADFRAMLSDSLSRQMRLNEIVAQAEHAGRTVYGPGGTIVTPVSTRVGAGILAAIEVVRIGLDCVAQYKAGAAAADLWAASHARLGIATMNWWLRLNVQPRIALAANSAWDLSSYKIVYEENQDLARKALKEDTLPNGVPKFDMVVVTGVPGSDLKRLVHRAVAELANLNDWFSFNGSQPGGPAFKKFDGGWGVRLWSHEDNKYEYTTVDDLEPGLSAELDRLQVELEKSQQDQFNQAAADPKSGGVLSVKDSAWVFGQDRRVTVYGPSGRWKVIDFDSVHPRFVRVETVTFPLGGVEGPVVKVKATDITTYRELAEQYWVEPAGESIDESGTHQQVTVHPNVDGYAYVRAGQLIPAD